MRAAHVLRQRRHATGHRTKVQVFVDRIEQHFRGVEIGKSQFARLFIRQHVEDLRILVGGQREQRFVQVLEVACERSVVAAFKAVTDGFSFGVRPSTASNLTRSR